MTGLQLLWFILICVLFIGFFFLEGFDFGVGMSTRLLARNDAEREALMATIGPHWDGNEVWLITAGGAMFASFPLWYASLFSGYYILLFLVLAALIFRGVSFEFSANADSISARHFWYWALCIGSTIAPFLLGMMFTSLIQGLPMDSHGDIYAGFTDNVNLLSIVGGVAVTLLCLIHGLNYTRLKIDGNMRDRARSLAEKLYFVLFAGEIIFVILLAIYTDFMKLRPMSTWAILILIVLFSALSMWGAYSNKEGLSFITSGLTLGSIVILLFNGLFPRVLIANNPAHSLLIKDAAASPYTLTIMTIVACILLPIMLVYFIWTFFLFKRRVKTAD
ncbi:cytochrome d ubiquinol oxidase subunit II [Agrilactobacillus fermenti]|uniref:cytochrome d ubiquinol oxidase subunit II n=1 Tax=Agrilactobacillus fermenti TaxID=2586909 RepID=UPI003A5C378A